MTPDTEINNRLQRFLPIRCLLGRAPLDNHPKGLVENSFSMDWRDDRILLFWSGKAYSILGEHKLDATKEIEAQLEHYRRQHPDWEFLALDPLAEDSPIEIDWQFWLDAREAGARRKYDSRNAPFKMREQADA